MSDSIPRIQVELRRYGADDLRVGVEITNGSHRGAIAMPAGDARKVAQAIHQAADHIEGPAGPPPERPVSDWDRARAGHLAQGEAVEQLARAFDEIRAEAIDQAAALLRHNPAAGPDEISALGPDDAPAHASETALSGAIKAYCFDEIDRHAKAMHRLVQRSVQHRLHFAYAALGSAIGMVDSFGGDTEMFVRTLRRRERRPAILTPPKGGMS